MNEFAGFWSGLLTIIVGLAYVLAAGLSAVYVSPLITIGMSVLLLIGGIVYVNKKDFGGDVNNISSKKGE